MEQEAWRILIVEDDRRLAELTREYLEGNGLKVDIEANGALAAARILAERPDLVVLDLMLPGEDGLSICRQVRPQFDGPILMLTALGDLHSAIVPHERTDTPRDRMNEQERCPYEHGFAGQRCIA